MPDPMFESLYRETGLLRWPSTEEVRRRGRRAGQRRIALVAAAAAVTVLAGGALADRSLNREAAPPPLITASPDASQSQSPPASASASTSAAPSAHATPSRGTGIPVSAMLQPSDLPAGYRLRDESAEGDWTFAFSASQCARVLTSRMPEPAERRSRAFTNGQPDTVVLQLVRQFPADGATRYLAQVREQTLECGGFPGRSEGLTVADEGFAGAESLLVHVVYEPGFETLHILVRQGDLVTEVWAKPTPDRQEAIRLAQRAAARLCTATSC